MSPDLQLSKSKQKLRALETRAGREIFWLKSRRLYSFLLKKNLIFISKMMEVTEIHNYSFETQREILEVEYSIQDDPQDTYREILLSKEEFNEYYLFGETMDIYDMDDMDDTHYELGTNF